MSRPVAAAISGAVVLTVGGSATAVWADMAAGQSIADVGPDVLVAAAFTGLGAVLVAARPGNRVTWLLMTIGVTWATAGGGLAAGVLGVSRPGLVPWTSAWILAGSTLRTVAWYLAVLGLAIYFPTGHVLGRRWRWLPWALAVSVLATVANGLVDPGANLDIAGWHNPIAIPPSLRFLESVTFLVGPPLAVVAGCFAVAQLVRRWRGGGPVERRQLGLFLAAAVPPVVAAPVGLAGGGPWVFYAAVLPLPLAVAVAVLRYRLYDLERVISRTVSYALVTGMLVGLYLGGVALLTDVLPFSSTLGTAISVLVAVALFAPLRRKMQATVDRRFNRARYDAAATVGDFAARLREQVDLDVVRDDLLAAVTVTVQPRTALLWLREPAR